MKKYFKVWWLFAFNSFQTQTMVRWGLLIFLLAKSLRFATFTLFIFVLVGKTQALAGYSLNEVMLFFLSFNLIDTLSQMVFREVYRFRPTILQGTFDFYLIKPYNPLFRSLTGGPDLIDFILLVPLIGALIYFVNLANISNWLNIVVYFLLLTIAFVIALSFHIFVLSLAVLTTEIDHAILVYRDITAMGRFPIDIYREPIRGLLTFALPVGIMMSFPVKSLLGLLSSGFIGYSILFTAIMLFLSLKCWEFSLSKYSSASS